MKSQLNGGVIFFATDNVNKFNEARKVLGEHGLSVGMLRVKAYEIQSDRLEEIARTSVMEAFRRCSLPLIVEDAGLFVDALKGFPGPYAAYIYKTIGNKGLLKLLEDVENRKASFHSVIAYYSTELESPICFRGEVTGEITKEERRGKLETGFGFDPTFRPAESNKTFAEMTTLEKNMYSHRAEALRKFAEWHRRYRFHVSEGNC